MSQDYYKLCNKCCKEKHFTAFGYHGKYLESRCKICRSEDQKEYYKNNKEKCNTQANKWAEDNRELSNQIKLKSRLKDNNAKERDRANSYIRQYGITISQYNELLVQQQYVCRICFKEESAIDSRTNKIKRLCVDHCHKTGRVRGLLCYNFNRGLGHFKDAPAILINASNYLENIYVK